MEIEVDSCLLRFDFRVSVCLIHKSANRIAECLETYLTLYVILELLIIRPARAAFGQNALMISLIQHRATFCWLQRRSSRQLFWIGRPSGIGIVQVDNDTRPLDHARFIRGAQPSTPGAEEEPSQVVVRRRANQEIEWGSWFYFQPTHPPVLLLAIGARVRSSVLERRSPSVDGSVSGPVLSRQSSSMGSKVNGAAPNLEPVAGNGQQQQVQNPPQQRTKPIRLKNHSQCSETYDTLHRLAQPVRQQHKY